MSLLGNEVIAKGEDADAKLCFIRNATGGDRSAKTAMHSFQGALRQPFFKDEFGEYVPRANYLGIPISYDGQRRDKNMGNRSPSSDVQPQSIIGTEATSGEPFAIYGAQRDERDGSLGLDEILQNINFKNSSGMLMKYSKEELLVIEEPAVLDRLRRIPLYRVDDVILRKAIRRASALCKRSSLDSAKHSEAGLK